MMLQRDIQNRIEALPIAQQGPLKVLLEAIANQARERHSDEVIASLVESEINRQLGGQENEN